MKRLIKGNKVKVISGTHSTKEGVILSINYKDNTAIIEGINVIKRHQKPSQANENKGGIISKEAPIQLSKLALVVPKSTTGVSKIGYSTEKGKKVRIAKKTKTEVGGK
ncbi:MAG: 50S ribosomal protein L24 [Mycoplasmataceae bacterium]|jgi:large subunit ribosomal protein L24|nr:50S ribosomal protein L24 [Mycoplasmataceae bacterium]